MTDLIAELRARAKASGGDKLLEEAAAALEAAREDAGKLRETLRAVSAVGIVQLFNTARDDVLAEFSLAELQEISRVTEHLRTAYVEHIYRAAWDAAIDAAMQRTSGGGHG